MCSLVKKIKSSPDALFGKGVSAEEIAKAEEKLQLKFAKEYCDYLSAFTVVAIDGRELTGLSNSKRVNVVAVTESQRKLNQDAPANLYVVEEANIDGIVVWQNESGMVYQTAPGAKMIKVADSLESYLKL